MHDEKCHPVTDRVALHAHDGLARRQRARIPRAARARSAWIPTRVDTPSAISTLTKLYCGVEQSGSSSGS